MPSANSELRLLGAQPAVAAPLAAPSPWYYRAAMAGLAALFVVAMMVLVYPLWPEAVYRWRQLHPSQTLSLAAARPGAPGASSARAIVPAASNRLVIPAIGVDTPIVEGPSLTILNQVEGVWHQTGGVNQSNLVLAGHRFKYLPPNTSTLYSLNRLHVGDAIEIDWLGKRIYYAVTTMEVVGASDVGILNPTATPQLTVYSCDDIYMTRRVVAIARPV